MNLSCEHTLMQPLLPPNRELEQVAPEAPSLIPRMDTSISRDTVHAHTALEAADLMPVAEEMLGIDQFPERAKSYTRDYALFYVQTHRRKAAIAGASAARQHISAADHEAVLQSCSGANDNLRKKLAETRKFAAHNESVARIHCMHANILEGYARIVPGDTRNGSGDVHLIEMAVNWLLDRFLNDENVVRADADPSKAYEIFDANRDARDIVDSTRTWNAVNRASSVSVIGGLSILHAGLFVAMPVTAFPSGIAVLVMALLAKNRFARDEAEFGYQQSFPKAIA